MKTLKIKLLDVIRDSVISQRKDELQQVPEQLKETEVRSEGKRILRNKWREACTVFWD